MRILQLNTTVNSGSTGRIAEEIGTVMMKNGHESYIAYGRGNRKSRSHLVKIGNQWDLFLHVIHTALFDRHGFGSKAATKKLIKKIELLQPDVIHMHNIHGYYLNVDILFDFVSSVKKPVVWTLHDCWAFTGHCAFFGGVNREESDCLKWKTQCQKCPKTRRYPRSCFLDRSEQNYNHKKQIFNFPKNLTIVTPSKWLALCVKQSFLNKFPVKVINNGVDLNRFRPVDPSPVFKKYQISAENIVLGVASIWDERKGLEEFIRLSKKLPDTYKVVLVGLKKNQITGLPKNIQGIPRTENTEELAALYSGASVFVNPTFLDNFPNTNIEALACGTPIITYKTGGSPEAMDEDTGISVPQGDISSLVEAISIICKKNRSIYRKACRTRAETNFSKEEKYKEYLQLYQEITTAFTSEK